MSERLSQLRENPYLKQIPQAQSEGGIPNTMLDEIDRAINHMVTKKTRDLPRRMFLDLRMFFGVEKQGPTGEMITDKHALQRLTTLLGNIISSSPGYSTNFHAPGTEHYDRHTE